MERELNGLKIKYESGKLYAWREMWRGYKLKNPDWRELKGCVNKGDGYIRVGINNKLYLYHRVVYFLHNDAWDIHNTSSDNSIDHIDRNRLNNSIENLRVVTNQQNSWNTYAKGYSFYKATGKYEAYIKVDGKLKHLGYFVSEDDARDAYLNAKEKYHIF
jgi:hypothetical protein|tara:strand:+ start:542 stop:1021 length:480 start_codon:yes stop_codon:yes gene_type:complete